MQACETNMPSVDAQVNAASTDAALASGALPAGLAAAAATSAAAGVNAAVASGAAVSPRDVASLRPNQRTRRVNVGGVPMGGGAPCVVQSMLNAPADDVEANLRQIRALEAAGCEVVRMAIPRRAYLDQFAEVCAKSPLPVVADVHFDAGIAIEAARRGAAKLRINPGNIGGWEKTDEVIEAARAAHIPIRVGVNAGSLDDA